MLKSLFVQNRVVLKLFLATALFSTTIDRINAASGPIDVVADPIEEGGGWNLIGGGWGYNGQMGFDAHAGYDYWGSSWVQPATVGLQKTFPATFVEPGFYTLTIYTMCPGSAPDYHAVPLTDFSDFGLTGISPQLRTVLSAPTPSPGSMSWIMWTLGYTVPEGSSDIGNPLGFKAQYQHTNNTGYSVMLDDIHVTLTEVPEPSIILLLGIAATGFLAYVWRRRK